MLGDKSIAHRALILCSWFKGSHLIENLPLNEDVLTTLSALESYGLKYVLDGNNISIDSTKFKFKANLWLFSCPIFRKKVVIFGPVKISSP